MVEEVWSDLDLETLFKFTSRAPFTKRTTVCVKYWPHWAKGREYCKWSWQKYALTKTFGLETCFRVIAQPLPLPEGTLWWKMSYIRQRGSSCRCIAPGLKKIWMDDQVVHPKFCLDRELYTHLQLRGEKICSRQTYHLLSGEVTNIAWPLISFTNFRGDVAIKYIRLTCI